MKIVGSACSNSPGEMKPQSLSAEEDFTEHIQIRLLKIRAEHATDWVSPGQQHGRTARPNPGVRTPVLKSLSKKNIKFRSLPRSRGVVDPAPPTLCVPRTSAGSSVVSPLCVADLSLLPLGQSDNGPLAADGHLKKVGMKLNALRYASASLAAANVKMALPIHHLSLLLYQGPRQSSVTYHGSIQWSQPGHVLYMSTHRSSGASGLFCALAEGSRSSSPCCGRTVET